MNTQLRASGTPSARAARSHRGNVDRGIAEAAPGQPCCGPPPPCAARASPDPGQGAAGDGALQQLVDDRCGRPRRLAAADALPPPASTASTSSAVVASRVKVPSASGRSVGTRNTSVAAT
ncbi:MAG TPA: hypothetical protein VKY26_07145 [Actinomycetota bacterium]|nr:hypothetical protein [Actinomycetota bacterium]